MFIPIPVLVVAAIIVITVALITVRVIIMPLTIPIIGEGPAVMGTVIKLSQVTRASPTTALTAIQGTLAAGTVSALSTIIVDSDSSVVENKSKFEQ